MLGALRASTSFIRRHWLSVVSLCAIDVAMFVAIVALYSASARAPVQFGRPARGLDDCLWIVINQLYVAGRLWVRLVFWARPRRSFKAGARATWRDRSRQWPDSPSAETIRQM
jgi:hypothetical protein